MNKKFLILALTLGFTVQLCSMEIVTKKEANKEITEYFKRVAHALEGGAIVSQGKILNDYIFLNLKETELLSCSTFKELIQEQNEKSLPFILAMLTTAGGLKNKDSITFFEASSLNNYLKQNDQKNRYNSSQNIYKNPINKMQIIDRIKYFTIDSLDDDFKYLGSDYDLFMGDKKKNEFMKDYFKANLGNTRVMNNLGVMYFQGYGAEKDYKEAFNWYKGAADLGNAIAMFNLGIMYFQGYGVEKNDKEAFNWLKRAADLGDASAMSSVGSMYIQGVGVEKNLDKANYWFNKAKKMIKASKRKS